MTTLKMAWTVKTSHDAISSLVIGIKESLSSARRHLHQARSSRIFRRVDCGTDHMLIAKTSITPKHLHKPQRRKKHQHMKRYESKQPLNNTSLLCSWNGQFLITKVATLSQDSHLSFGLGSVCVTNKISVFNKAKTLTLVPLIERFFAIARIQQHSIMMHLEQTTTC